MTDSPDAHSLLSASSQLNLMEVDTVSVSTRCCQAPFKELDRAVLLGATAGWFWRLVYIKNQLSDLLVYMKLGSAISRG